MGLAMNKDKTKEDEHIGSQTSIDAFSFEVIYKFVYLSTENNNVSLEFRGKTTIA